jgi:hypothetical protein
VVNIGALILYITRIDSWLLSIHLAQFELENSNFFFSFLVLAAAATTTVNITICASPTLYL